MTPRRGAERPARASGAPRTPVASRPRSPGRSGPPPAAPARPSLGHALLLDHPASSAEIGRRIGHARGTVSAWRVGRKVPTPGARRLLEEHYGISAHAWDAVAPAPQRAPRHSQGRAVAPLERVLPGWAGEVVLQSADARGPGVEPLVPATAARAQQPAFASGPERPLAEVDELLATLRTARSDPSLLSSEKIRTAREERALIGLRARLALQAATSDATIEALCVRHPKWVQLRDAIITALAPHREALLAVADVLRAFGVEVES